MDKRGRKFSKIDQFNSFVESPDSHPYRIIGLASIIFLIVVSYFYGRRNGQSHSNNIQKVSIRSEPEGSHIFISGVDIKLVTPAVLDLPLGGDANISVRMDGFEQSSVERGAKNSSLELDFTLLKSNVPEESK